MQRTLPDYFWKEWLKADEKKQREMLKESTLYAVRKNPNFSDEEFLEYFNNYLLDVADEVKREIGELF